MTKAIDIETIKAATDAAFTPALKAWLGTVIRTDPLSAVTELVAYFGFALAGAALELGVADRLDAEGIGETIREIFEEHANDSGPEARLQ